MAVPTLDVRGDERLLAAARVLRDFESFTPEITRRVQRTMSPVWRGLISRKAGRWNRDQAVLARNARIEGIAPPVARAADSTRAMRGGFVPAEQWHAVEFGANREKVTTYMRRGPNGDLHRVTRHTSRQMPPRIRKGRIVYPAFAELVPRLASMWVQTIMRTTNELLEKAVG